MGFQAYAGSGFLPYILPIIPKGAPLGSVTTLTPDRLGKIPGFRHADGWGGFPKHIPWSKHITDPGHLKAWAAMYAQDGLVETIGLQLGALVVVDIDWENPEIAELVVQIAGADLGLAPIRCRSNSAKALLLYRLKEGSRPVLKQRALFRTMFAEQGATEILGKGQQCLIEGMHPSGVLYEWRKGITPLVLGFDHLTEVTADQVDAFMAHLNTVLTTEYGCTRIKGGGNARFSGVFNDTEASEVGSDHPELCPDLDMLKELLTHIPCTLPEFATYDEWAAACVAIVTACGKDESFWPSFLEWCSAIPANVAEGEDYVRGKWESVNESKIGWAYLCHIAHDYGYTGDAQRAFDELPTGEGQPPATPTARRDGTYEAVIADAFIAEHAKKKWIYEQTTDTRGVWRGCYDGIWVKDQTVLYDVSQTCQLVGNAIRSNSQASAAQLSVAKQMFSERTAKSVLGLARANPAIVVYPKQLDENTLLLGVPGGYVDPDGRLREPDPKLLLTKSAGVRPDFSARCPLFESRLMSLANKDPEVYDCLWDLIGYSLTGLGQERMFVFIHGRHGGEGKTTLTTLMGMLLGDYARPILNKAFVKTRYEQRFSVASLQGYRFVFANEIEKGEEWAGARLKEATGGGFMEIERKGIQAEPMEITSTLWFTGNYMPSFPPGDEALKERMVVIECETPISREEDVKGFAKKVFAKEGPAILARAIEARQRYLARDKLIIPASIREKVNAHFLAKDPTWQFVLERCKFVPDVVVEKQPIYTDYARWEIDTLGRKIPTGRNTFYERLENHPEVLRRGVTFGRKRLSPGANNPQSVVQGLCLITDFTDLSEAVND